MGTKPILKTITSLTVLAIASASTVCAQTPVLANRIAQPVVIGGQRVDGVYVLAPRGGIQSYSCPTPRQYVTPDGASQGWACFDSATDVWFLSALPPRQPAPAPVVVQQAILQPAYPLVIYRAPHHVIYTAPAYYPRVVGRFYSPSAAIGVAAINAAGRIAAAVISTSRFHDDHRSIRVVGNRGHRR